MNSVYLRVKFGKFNFPNYSSRRKGLFFVFLLFLFVLLFSSLVFMLNADDGVSPFVFGAPDVTVGDEATLRNAVNTVLSKGVF